MATQSKTVFVIHAYEPPDGSRMLRLNLGDEWWNLPTGELVEIEQGSFYAEKLVEVYGPVYGIIIAPSERTRTGITVDTKRALEAARKYQYDVETVMLNRWVMEQRSDRVKQNLPVLPPSGRVEEIINTRGIDLKQKFNLVPVGYEAESPAYPAAAPMGPDLTALLRENAELKAQVSAQDVVQSELAARLAKIEETIA